MRTFIFRHDLKGQYHEKLVQHTKQVLLFYFTKHHHTFYKNDITSETTFFYTH